MQRTDTQNNMLKAREIDDLLLQGILALSIKKMEENPYCRKILEEAKYQQKRPEPDKFDENHFYLEKIYVGHGCNGPTGHCTKEKISEESDAPTRDAVYINENLVKMIIIDSLKTMSSDYPTANDILMTEIAPRPHASEQKFINFQELFESYVQNGKDKNGMNEKCLNDVWQYQQIRSKLLNTINSNNKFATTFLKMTSDVLLNTVAHECAHGNQMNNGMKEISKETKSLSGQALADREKFYNDVLSGKTSMRVSPPNREELIIGRSEEAIAEAGVMAHSYIAFLAVYPDDRAISQINEFYNVRLSENKISPLSAEERQKMFALENGRYTAEAQALQQQQARKLFTALLKDFGAMSMAKIDEDARMDYNSPSCFDVVKSSYQKDIFGSLNDYIQAIPEPGLSEERKKDLRDFVKKRDARQSAAILYKRSENSGR